MSGEIYWIDDKEGTFPEGAVKERLEEVCGATIRSLVATHDTLDEILGLLEEGGNVKLIVLDYWLEAIPKPLS